MSREDHDGIFDSGKCYTHKAVARLLGLTERWVIEHFLRREELPCKRLGNLYFISGHNLNLWVERTSAPWEDEKKGGSDE